MSDNEFNSALSDDSLRSVTDTDLDKVSDDLKQFRKLFDEEKTTTTAKINLINEKISGRKNN